jgi:hypothetical protein
MANVILVEFQVQLNRTQIAYWPPISGDLVRGFIPNGTGYVAGGSYPQEDVDALLTGVTTTPPVIPPSTTTVTVTDNANGSMTVNAGAGGVQAAIRPIWELTEKSVPDTVDQIVVLDINGNLLRSPISGLPAGGGSTTIVDGLTSTSTTSALSANQGRLLNTSIGSLSSSLSALSSTVSGQGTSLATTSNNGITKTSGNFALGGSLTAATTITTSASFTLAWAGLVSDAAPQNVVTLTAGGVMRITAFTAFASASALAAVSSNTPTGLSFSGGTLTLARNGAADLTVSIPTGGGSSTAVFQGTYASPATGTIAVGASTTTVIAASGSTITALTPASHSGRKLNLKMAGSGSVNISAWNIDGATGRTLSTTDQSIGLESTGVTWIRV